jgi:hypothetical protein
MTTYDIEVRGIKIFEKVSQEDLQKSINQVRGIVWTRGGNDQDILITLNKNETPLQ